MEEHIFGFDKPKVRDLSVTKSCKFCGRLYHPTFGKSETNKFGKGYCTPSCYQAALRDKITRRRKNQ